MATSIVSRSRIDTRSTRTAQMDATYVRYGFLTTLALMLAGCVPASSSPTDDAGGAVTYTKDVQPIFMAKCSPCHAGQNLGKHDIATTYADVLRPIESFDSFGCWNDTDPTMNTMPKKIGECSLVLIMNGRMPNGAGCGNAIPLEPAMCLSSDQKAVIAAWVAGGMRQ